MSWLSPEVSGATVAWEHQASVAWALLSLVVELSSCTEVAGDVDQDSDVSIAVADADLVAGHNEPLADPTVH